MKKFLANTFAFLVLLILILLVISYISATSYDILSYEPDRFTIKVTSYRMKNINYSLPLFNTCEYNWPVFFNRYYDNSKENKYNKGFIPVHSDIYLPLSDKKSINKSSSKHASTSTVSYSSFDVKFMSVMRDDLSVNQKRLNRMANYYKSRKLLFSDVQAVSTQSGKYYSAYNINYTQKVERVKKAIKAQLNITYKILKNNNLNRKYLIIIPGYIEHGKDSPEDTFSNNEIQTAINNTAFNIFDAWNEWTEKNKSEKGINKISILLQNNLPQRNEKNRYYIGTDYRELILIRDRVLFLNKISVSSLSNLEKRVGLSLDVSRLVWAWEQMKEIYFEKNQKKVPRESIIIGLQKRLLADLYRSELKKGAEARVLNHIILSYFRTNTEKYSRSSASLFENQNQIAEDTDMDIKYDYLRIPDDLYLPYTRSSNTRFLIEQLKLASSLIEISDIGMDKPGVINFNFHRRENFPVLHTFFRPLIELTSLFQYFILKTNGADSEEQMLSLDWINKYLQYSLH
jgi:hypothetical protein